MSLMQQYADIYGIPLQEVKEWVNDFANGNVPDSVKEWMGADKKERIESIKAYIQGEIYGSLTGQIKGQIVADRIQNSVIKQVDKDLCPF